MKSLCCHIVLTYPKALVSEENELTEWGTEYDRIDQADALWDNLLILIKIPTLDSDFI